MAQDAGHSELGGGGGQDRPARRIDLIGLSATLLTGVLSGSLALAIPLGAAVALVAFAAQLVYINRTSIWLTD